MSKSNGSIINKLVLAGFFACLAPVNLSRFSNWCFEVGLWLADFKKYAIWSTKSATYLTSIWEPFEVLSNHRRLHRLISKLLTTTACILNWMVDVNRFFCSSFNSHLQLLMIYFQPPHAYHSCCVPDGTEPMEVMFTNNNKVHMVKELPDMRVTKCRCT